jgi:hypothetical protein
MSIEGFEQPAVCPAGWMVRNVFRMAAILIDSVGIWEPFPTCDLPSTPARPTDLTPEA